MKRLLLVITALLAISTAADAKWWIFGKSGGEVGLKYLYVNKISADETGSKIKVFKEALGPGGLIKISGKASVGRSAVGSVRLSLDDKATWVDVKFTDNGTFEHSFKPEPGKAYVLLVEVTDTAGKTNKVDETRKEIALSDENIQAKVRETLDAMFDAYNKENLGKFMSYVGENFAGDKVILERAVKRDFDALSSINLRYTINNISAGAQGRVFVSVTYNRMVLLNKTGASSTDTGATEFVFDSKEGRLSLFSMKQPLMFGLSDADNVATGTVIGGGTALVLDDAGGLGGGTLVTHSCPASTLVTYTFTSGLASCTGGDIWFYDGVMGPPGGGMGFVTMNAASFTESLASISSSEVRDPAAYSSMTNFAYPSSGTTYCFQPGTDYYCLEVISMPTASNETVSFRLKKF